MTLSPPASVFSYGVAVRLPGKDQTGELQSVAPFRRYQRTQFHQLAWRDTVRRGAQAEALAERQQLETELRDARTSVIA